MPKTLGKVNRTPRFFKDPYDGSHWEFKTCRVRERSYNIWVRSDGKDWIVRCERYPSLEVRAHRKDFAIKKMRLAIADIPNEADLKTGELFNGQT